MRGGLFPLIRIIFDPVVTRFDYPLPDYVVGKFVRVNNLFTYYWYQYVPITRAKTNRYDLLLEATREWKV